MRIAPIKIASRTIVAASVALALGVSAQAQVIGAAALAIPTLPTGLMGGIPALTASAIAAPSLEATLRPSLIGNPAGVPVAHNGAAAAVGALQADVASLIEKIAAPRAGMGASHYNAANIGELMNGGRMIKASNAVDAAPSAEEEVNARVYNEGAPSTVEITNMQLVRGRDRFGDVREGVAPAGTGSGYVWDKEGHIVTNFHVAQDGAAFLITLHDGRKVEAKLIGGDPQYDIAILQVDPETARTLKPIRLGSSDDLQVGHRVFAIGSPLGLPGTFTTGIISALDRTIAGLNGREMAGAIQHSAPINPGNSGGPLLDRNARLIGMNAQIVSVSGGNIGIGFAIPVSAIKDVVTAVLRHGGGIVQRGEPRRGRYTDVSWDRSRGHRAAAAPAAGKKDFTTSMRFDGSAWRISLDRGSYLHPVRAATKAIQAILDQSRNGGALVIVTVDGHLEGSPKAHTKIFVITKLTISGMQG